MNDVDRPTHGGATGGLAWSPGTPRREVLTRITSESATVELTLVRTGNGQRLALSSERSGDSVELDATLLDALCSVRSEQLTEIVRVAVEGPGDGA